MGFYHRSQINNYFNIFLCSSYAVRRICTKSKHFFQFQQKIETNIAPLSANHIAQTPQGPHYLTDQKQYHNFKIENGLTVLNTFNLHYCSKEYWISSSIVFYVLQECLKYSLKYSNLRKFLTSLSLYLCNFTTIFRNDPMFESPERLRGIIIWLHQWEFSA